MASPLHRNRLADESSAYLLQHATNPVDWHPWGPAALHLAKSLDRPILLSIGYSACHWCHVMERESFEDPAIASLMNAHFVCIKVDREERPDLDHLYMAALQGMTGRGGWPMTMFLTPAAKPFYAGTYFPPEDRGGMPGLARVLLGVAKTWADKPEEVTDSAARVIQFLHGEPVALSSGQLSAPQLREAALSLTAAMDLEYGGFGVAPKFPSSMALSLLMEAEALGDGHRGKELVRLSLDSMAAGGIRDHLGGGFHRYSVDREWTTPHFEKMLSDQALLASLYVAAWRFFEDESYATVAAEVFDFVIGEMRSPEGGFFSAQDADSEGEEGRYFVWDHAEILNILGPDRALLFCEAYGVTAPGNHEGRSILRRVSASPASTTALALSEVEAELAISRETLLRARHGRVAPQVDRKIVADWNGLMISAMATGGEILGRPDFVNAAARAFDAITCSLLDAASLGHVRGPGDSKVEGFLDDYAFFGRGCLDLFSVRPKSEYLETAHFCADRLLEDFLDSKNGGFHFAGMSGEVLVARTCDSHDGAVPAGNSVAAELLFRLWSLTGRDDYRRAAQGVLDRFLGQSLRNPHRGSHLLSVAEHCRRGWRTVVVQGEATARICLARAGRSVFDLRSTVIALESPHQDWYPPALDGKAAPPNGAWAYLCQGNSCSMPLDSEDRLKAALQVLDFGE